MEKRDRATHDLFGLSRRCRRLRLRLRVRREEAVFIEHHKSREWRRNGRTNERTDADGRAVEAGESPVLHTLTFTVE